MDKNYQDDFIKLLYSYKENINKLDSLSFSTLIYLIEQKYFIGMRTYNDISFKSDLWIPEIKKLCLVFLEKLTNRPGGQYLRFRDELIGTIEKPGRIAKEYHKCFVSLKKKAFGKNGNKDIMNYYKTAAIYIRSFLMYKPFYLNVPDNNTNAEKCLYTALANEFFIIIFLEVIFRLNNKPNGFLEMDQNYRDDFIKLLYYYKQDIKKFDPISFSYIIHFIEQQYFRSL